MVVHTQASGFRSFARPSKPMVASLTPCFDINTCQGACSVQNSTGGLSRAFDGRLESLPASSSLDALVAPTQDTTSRATTCARRQRSLRCWAGGVACVYTEDDDIHVIVRYANPLTSKHVLGLRPESSTATSSPQTGVRNASFSTPDTRSASNATKLPVSRSL